jgi:hypothetical protein
MAGIIEKVRELIAPRVRNSLAEAEQNLVDLEAKLAPLYLSEVLDPAVTSERKALERKVAEARALIDRLRVAEQQAAQRDLRTLAEQDIAAIEAKRADYAAILAAHREAAGELDQACEQLATAYRRLQASSELVRAAAPLPIPRGYTPINIRQLLAHQLHRVSGAGAALGANDTLPGALAPTISLMHNPDGVEPAAEAIANEVAYVESVMARAINQAAAVLREEPTNEVAA